MRPLERRRLPRYWRVWRPVGRGSRHRTGIEPPRQRLTARGTVYGPRGGVKDAGQWAPGTGVSAGRQLRSHGRAAARWRSSIEYSANRLCGL